MNTTSLAPPDGSVAITHWGVIRAHGADAVSFLQGQLTNDVAHLGETQVRLAGFCSAKGRLQASFLVWKVAADEVLLACAASVLPATLKRLSMFVLRAKCKLSDASAELALHGVVGASARTLFESTGTAVGADAQGSLGAQAIWTLRATADDGTVIRLPDVDGVARGIVVVHTLDTPAAALPATLTLDNWRALEVRSGIAMIEAATVDQFVPQMLNYELVGAVDFQKGCYPGQEIVARSQYRGTIKRRTFLFESDLVPLAGQEVFHDIDPTQPAGMIVNAAPQGSVAVALVEVKLAALERGGLHVGSVDGPLLTSIALPYAVPLDAAQSA